MAVGPAALAVNDRAGLDQVIRRTEGAGAEQSRLAARAEAARAEAASRVASNDAAEEKAAERSTAAASEETKVSRKAVDAATSISDTLQKVRTTLETLSDRSLSATRRAELSDQLRQLSGQVAKFVDGAEPANGEGAGTGSAAAGGGAAGASAGASDAGGASPSGGAAPAGGDPLATVAKSVGGAGSGGTPTDGGSDGRVASILSIGGAGTTARAQSDAAGGGATAAGGTGGTAAPATATPRTSGGGPRAGLGDSVPGVPQPTATGPRAGLGDGAPAAPQLAQTSVRNALGEDRQRATPSAAPAPGAPATPAAPTPAASQAATEPDVPAPTPPAAAPSTGPALEASSASELEPSPRSELEPSPRSELEASPRSEIDGSATPDGRGSPGQGEDFEDDPRAPKRRAIAVQGAIVSASGPSGAPAGSIASVQDGSPIAVVTGASRTTPNAFFGDSLLPADVGSIRNDPPAPREPPISPLQALQSVAAPPPGEATERAPVPPSPVVEARAAVAIRTPQGETDRVAGRSATAAPVAPPPIRVPEGEVASGRQALVGGSGPISADQASAILSPGSALDRLSTSVARRLGAIAADQGTEAAPASSPPGSFSAAGSVQGATVTDVAREATAGANDNPRSDGGIAVRTAAIRRRGGIVNLFA